VSTIVSSTANGSGHDAALLSTLRVNTAQGMTAEISTSAVQPSTALIQ
jgi:hypothetical protein